MEDEVRKKLKSFDDVLVLINDMIQNIDELMKVVDSTPSTLGNIDRKEENPSESSPNIDT